MARLKACDIKDELIAPYIANNADILAECDAYLNDFVQSKTNAGYGIADVAEPLPYKLKGLAVAWVCREVCGRKAGTAGAAYRGQEANSDKYSTKLAYFNKLVRDLEEQITPGVILGVSTSRVIGSVLLKRG